jgi:hypothetical protein
VAGLVEVAMVEAVRGVAGMGEAGLVEVAMAAGVTAAAERAAVAATENWLGSSRCNHSPGMW